MKMKKIFFLIFIGLMFSIIFEAYLHSYTIQQFDIELNNFADLPFSYFEEQNENHEFIQVNISLQNFNDIQLSEIKTNNYYFFLQKHSNQIWQPPEFIL
jgi:hypothetical protein